jgi:hypothetical protein
METPADTSLTHRAEEDLIKSCAFAAAQEDRGAALRPLVGESLNWDYILEVCQAHGISSLVGHNLEVNAPDLVPGRVRAVFQARFKANACRNLYLTRELLALIQEFRRNGIAVIPFKGPLLAVTAYGNIALREFVDLDILVQKKNLRRARELLATRGYRSRAGQLTESYLKSQLGCDLVRADGLAALELHWSFVQRWLGFRVDLEAIWAAPQPVLLGSVPVLVLPLDITLLYLCAHGAKHCWSRLCWVVDVAAVLRTRPNLDWGTLLALAESSGCQRTLFIGLHLAKTLLGASIADGVWARVQQDKLAVALARNLGEQMFAPREGVSRSRFGWRRDWFYIRTKERWREKLVCLGHVAQLVFLPSDKDRNWISLPRRLAWLYVFLRPIRITLQCFPWSNGADAYRVAR